MTIGGVKRSLVMRHFGVNEFSPEVFKKPENGDWIKPKKGGLWTSPTDSKWGWGDWCRAEDFRTETLKNHFLIKMNPDARILVIDSLADLQAMHFKKLIEPQRLSCKIDFEKIAEDYDAIWLTEKGESETRYSRPLTMYGWDVETVLILNIDCFTVIKNKDDEKNS